MTVLPRIRCQGRPQVFSAAWLWADIDGGLDGIEGARSLLNAADLPAPHMVVVNGGRLTAFFQLSETVPVPDDAARLRFRQVLKNLCCVIGGDLPGAHADASRANVMRICRVPGTVDHGQDPPRPVLLDLWEMSADTHPFDWCIVVGFVKTRIGLFLS